MLIDLERNVFLHPSSLMYELLILHEMKQSGYLCPPRKSVRQLSDAMIHGYLLRFAEAGWIEAFHENSDTVYRLTPNGLQRLQILLVDYVQELIKLYGSTFEIFRKRLVEFYLEGIRKVAFYPIGETAEVVYRALQGSGLQLIVAIDDDQMRWNTSFHEVTIEPPEALLTSKVDGVLLTTAVFQSEVVRRIELLGLEGVRVLSL